MKLRIVFSALGVLGVLSLSTAGYCQVTTATIYGRVIDPTGGAVGGADVTAANELTGAETKTQSNTIGQFTFTFLPIGRYTVSVAAAGFKTRKETGLVLVAAQEATLDFRLELGSLSEVVAVTSSPVM